MRLQFATGLATLILLLAAPVHAGDELHMAEPVHCPAKIAEGPNKYSLESAGIFRGRIDNLIEIMPENGAWNLEDYRAHTRKRIFYLVCRFEDTPSILRITIPQHIHLCSQDGNDIVCR